MNNQNIFERFSARNQEDNFSSISPVEPPVNDFTNPVNDNAKLVDQASGNIFERLAGKQKEKEQNSFGLFDTLRDVGEQVVSKGISGISGAYGNLAETFGLQLPPGKTTPGQQERNKQQFQVLEKLSRGEVPSIGEFLLLSDDDDKPSYNRLATSKEIQQGIQDVTGVGQGKTPTGRIAGRGAEFVGEGLAIPGSGVKGLLSLAGAGLAGQGVREAGGPESLASGVEIGGSIIPSIIQGKVNPRGGEAKKIADAGHQIGLTEKQIAPLIQGEGKLAAVAPVARKGTKVKDRFASIKESLGDSYANIKQSVSNLGNVNNANRIKLETKFTDIANDLKKTLKPSPDKEAAINFIQDAVSKLSKNGTSAEELINFWQDINKSVKWNSLQGGKKALSRLKEPILDVLNNVAPQAAKDFELTNQLYSKYSQIAKKLKPDLVDSFANKAEILSAVPSGIALATGNPWPLVGLGGEVATRLLAREMLLNPYFQNLGNKLVTNFNQGSVKAIKELIKQAQDYMKRKHPNEDWAFLTDSNTSDTES